LRLLAINEKREQQADGCEQDDGDECGAVVSAGSLDSGWGWRWWPGRKIYDFGFR
jgi:hypothetical protein